MHCGRPFKTLDEMNEKMVGNHNGIVGKRDKVILVGDFAWARHMHFIHALNGKKTLVIGNHDRMSQTALSQFSEVIGTPKAPGILQTTIDGQYCVFCHFPMWSWNASFHGSWHFYGHCHGRKREIEDRKPEIVGDDDAQEYETPHRLMEFADGLSCAVDADVWDYTPVPWEVLKAKMESRVEAWKARRDAWKSAPHLREAGKDYPSQLAAQNRAWRAKVQGGQS